VAFSFPCHVCGHPLISVYSVKGKSSRKNATLPTVFKAPIQPDIVTLFIPTLRKNSRQPYAIGELVGHQTSAGSWGSGRAVARIPRVRGVEPTDLAKLPLEICVEEVACLCQPKPGVIGTVE
jgi:hypothetical protein